LIKTSGEVIKSGRLQRGRPKTKTDKERREHILMIAYSTFMKVGYGATTIDLIAREGKISKQTFYRTFADRTELFAEMISAHRREMLALPRDPEESLPPDVALEKIFRVELEEAGNFERHHFVHHILSAARQYPEALVLLKQYGSDRAQEELATWLSHSSQRGVLHVVDPTHAAGVLMSMIFSPISNADFNLSNTSLAGRGKHIRQCIRVFLGGIGALNEK